MKKIIFIVLIFTGCITFAQTNKSIEQNIKEATENLKKTDSILAAHKKRMDSIDLQRFNENNAKAITSFMNERNAKAKKNAYLRIGIGIGFLLLLIIGLLRKRKKN